MANIAARELRNHLGAVLRRVEAGERLRVTLSGRPVAELAPLPWHPATLPWAYFARELQRSLADAGLDAQLRELVSETTDDVRISGRPGAGLSRPRR